MSEQHPEVVIIGAGILGISCAYHLASRGRSVLVLEREPTYGAHASGKTAGMFRQLYRNPQLTEWAMRSRESWPERALDVGFSQTGSVIVGREVPEHHQDLFLQCSVDARYEGGIKSVPAVYTASDGLVSPKPFLDALYSACDETKIHFSFSTRCTELKQKDGIWKVTCSDGSKFETPNVVNCAGAWLNDFLRPNCRELVVSAEAYARHLFVVSGFDNPSSPLNEVGFYWEENADWYVRRWSKSAGLVSVCDLLACDPDSFKPNPSVVDQVYEKITRSLPELNKIDLDSAWHCFRTYTDDKLPIWGADPNAPGLFWLAAFGGFGISTGFAAAQDAARAICGESTKVPLSFSPQRVQLPANSVTLRA